MGYAEAAKKGFYILTRQYQYNKDTGEIECPYNWGYLDTSLYGGDEDMLKDTATGVYLCIPQVSYMEFAVTDVPPGDTGLPADYYYNGETAALLAVSKKLANSCSYMAPPYVQTVIPATTGRLKVGSTYEVTITYDEDLELVDTPATLEDNLLTGSTGLSCTVTTYNPDRSTSTADTRSKVENVKWDGKRTITLDFTPSEYWEDDTIMYYIQPTGIVGEVSKKAPNSVGYAVSHGCVAFAYRNQGYDWNVFGKPALMDNVEVGTGENEGQWLASDGTDLTEQLKDLSSRLVLVTTEAPNADAAAAQEKETTAAIGKEDNGVSAEDILTTKTYNINLTLCKSQIIQTGQSLRVSVGFPEGYDSATPGVTFQAYHFKSDGTPELVDCVVTQYGLVITCNSFSPYAIAVVKDDDDGTTPKDVTAVVSSSSGGQIAGTENGMLTLKAEESKTLEVTAYEGYQIDSISIGGTQIEVTEEANQKIEITYDQIANGNGVIDAKFIAKTVVARVAEEHPEESLVQTVVDVNSTTSVVPDDNVGETETPLATPIITSVKADGKNVVVSWNGFDNVETFEVYRSESETGEYTKIADVEESTYTDTKVSTGKTYYYKVKAISEKDEDLNSELSTASSVKLILETPEITEAKVDGKNVVVNWNKVDNAQKFEVYRASSETGEYTKIATTDTNTYTDTKVATGNAYYYKVKAIIEASEEFNSEFSNVVSTKLALAAPVATGTKVDGRNIVISWDKVENAQKYEVYYADSSDGAYVKVGDTNTTSYTHTGAVGGKVYYYKIKAINETSADLSSAFSNVVSAKITLAAPVATGAKIDGKNVVVSWSSVDNAQKYEVYRSESETGTYEKITTTEANTYTDTTATVGKSYYYKVKAITEAYTDVNSDFSNVVVSKAALAAPVATEAKVDGRNIVISWNGVENAQKYEVYRSDSETGTYNKIGTTEKNTYTDTPAGGQAYYYKVKAIDETSTDLNSEFSNAVSAKLTLAVPEVSGIIDKDDNVKISWNSVANAKKYEVYRLNSETNEYVVIATTTENSYTDTTVTKGNTYAYRVKAINEATPELNSAFSDTVTAKIALETLLLTGIINTDGNVVITWNSVSTAKQYEVYRSDSENGEYNLIGTVDGTTYTDNVLIGGTTYYYKVKAILSGSADLSSEFSNITFATVALKAPVVTGENNADGHIVISWKSVTNASSYEIYRGSSASDMKVIETTNSTSYVDSETERGATYFYKVKAIYKDDETLSSKDSNVVEMTDHTIATGTEALFPERVNSLRVSGQNRYDTAISTANSLKTALGVEKFENIIVAYGDDYADALAGSFLANAKNAPILIVNKSSESKIKTYIDENLASGGTIYLLGGTGVVSTDFEKSLSQYTVERLGGKNRFATNMEILQEAGVTGDDVLICSAYSFADSLSASAVGEAILLVGNTLTDDQKTYLASLGKKNYYIIGGTGAVTQAVENELKTYGTVERVAGANRYSTSAEVAKTFFSEGSDAVVLAYGLNFPDGLSGGPLAMALGAPLLLVSSNSTNNASASEYVSAKTVDKAVCLGGSALISDAAVKEILGTK
jgi:fibronectin type 3 domain-containing protein/putative cell wall-binding protein